MVKKIKDIIFILVLGSVSTLLLLGIKAYTYPKIARYEELKLKTTILDAAGINYNRYNYRQVFNKNIHKVTKNGFVYYLGPNNFYIFEFQGRGLWGLIKGVVSLKPDLETIKSIKIIFQEETPGLGGRITEASFLKQFENKKVFPQLNLTLRRKAEKNNEVDSISGASMTSMALVKMINETVKKLRQSLSAE
jgi:Na+-transporting NADH:ubiquinone oxidoreductase subunit C